MPLTKAEHDKEWAYVLDERRGMQAGAGPLSPEQEAQAQREAREHMDRLERESQ